MNTLRDHLLETLSFFDSYTVERIILDMNEEILLNYPDFTKDGLIALLKELEREKIVKSEIRDQEVFWLKIYPRKTLWERILKFFKL